MEMKQKIINLYEARPASYSANDMKLFEDFINSLNTGTIRSAEKIGGHWVVNEWVKMGILIGFRMGTLAEMQWSPSKSFFDKDTLPEKRFCLEDSVRLVPGGSSARSGCYVAAGVVIMPPAFINVGAYVDGGTLIDSHALVGSCAQIGKNVHLSAGAMIGGVLEPIGNRPVIVEDEAFIGGNTGIYEGVIVQSRAVIAPGTVITASTPVFDAVNDCYISKEKGKPAAIPENAVVVPGSRTLRDSHNFSVYCPIIIKYRDEKTELSVVLEQDIREFID